MTAPSEVEIDSIQTSTEEQSGVQFLAVRATLFNHGCGPHDVQMELYNTQDTTNQQKGAVDFGIVHAKSNAENIFTLPGTITPADCRVAALWVDGKPYAVEKSLDQFPSRHILVPQKAPTQEPEIVSPPQTRNPSAPRVKKPPLLNPVRIRLLIVAALPLAWYFFAKQVWHDPTGHTSGSCAVTTAAFGDAQHPMVVKFRKLRDEVLVNYKAGRAFIGWYNINGPKIAKHIEDHPRRMKACRAVLIPLADGVSAVRATSQFVKKILKHLTPEPPDPWPTPADMARIQGKVALRQATLQNKP